MSEKIVPQHLVFSFEPTAGLDQIWTFFFVIAHLQFQSRVREWRSCYSCRCKGVWVVQLGQKEIESHSASWSLKLFK